MSMRQSDHPVSDRSNPPAPLARGPSLMLSPAQIVEVDMEMLDVIRRLNLTIFKEQRIINTFDRDGLLMLLAYVDEQPVGFKVGYRESRFVFYSAKGGVLPAYRRQGIARHLLQAMTEHAQKQGYARFAYDTFPNKHPGMTILGLNEGFRITKADYNTAYKDYRLRFEKKL